MKSPRYLTFIRLMMIFSQLALMGFVGQWLWTVYVKERNRLDVEISRRFHESGKIIQDSILMVRVIDPLMKENITRQMTLKITMDSLNLDPAEWKETTIVNDSMRDTCKGVFAIMTDGTNHEIDTPVLFRRHELTGANEVFLQGMKLVIQRMEDSLLIPSGMLVHQVPSLKDTARMKKIFFRELQDIDPSMRIIWTTNNPPSDSFVFIRSRFHYELSSPEFILAATLKNPFLVVMKEITSSVLFALALVILTGASFVIAFRSLKKQILLNRMRSGFVSNITHELKTPVSTVKVALEALKRFDLKSDPEKTEEYLSMASSELNRLDLLISQVLNVSLYEGGGLVMHREPANLKEIVSDVIRLMAPAISSAVARVEVMEAGNRFIAPVDTLHIQGVLFNLLDNSLKYGGEYVLIKISLLESDREIVIKVSDNGPGIPDEYIDRIFEKFFRVPSGESHNTKGYGLGLSYAAMVIQQHGGTIGASNNPEGGVTFTVSIPTM